MWINSKFKKENTKMSHANFIAAQPGYFLLYWDSEKKELFKGDAGPVIAWKFTEIERRTPIVGGSKTFTLVDAITVEGEGTEHEAILCPDGRVIRSSVDAYDSLALANLEMSEEKKSLEEKK
jgi:hypothetical protein